MKSRQPRTAPKVSQSAREQAPSELSPSRERALFAVSSLLLLVPCFWQSRLQISDLESHIYNAWLAQLIESGQAPGLAIVPQKTNVLFDWILSALFRLVGAGPAQKISVALCVLIFVWGAFAFISRVSGRRPWHLMPLLGVLAYGWTLHMGFLNFYLSLGLCLWAMALAWNWTFRGLLLAAPLVPIAGVAHSLPLFWAVAIMAYAWLWSRMPATRRWYLPVGALAAIVLGVAALRNTLPTLWMNQQMMNILGVDQAMVFGRQYGLVLLGLSAAVRGAALQIDPADRVREGLLEPALPDLAADTGRSSGGAQPGLHHGLQEFADVHRGPYVAGPGSVPVRGIGGGSGAPHRAVRTRRGGASLLRLPLPRRGNSE